jgi:hypothetical protein
MRAGTYQTSLLSVTVAVCVQEILGLHVNIYQVLGIQASNSMFSMTFTARLHGSSK